PSPAPWAPAPRPARVAVQRRRVADIRAADGTPLDTLDLEPEVLATLGRSGGALDAGADPAPPACRAAVLAAEDRHFFHHPGIDPTAIARALLADLRAGGRRQGGSTISQHLAKNVFLTPRRTLGRKAREAVLALLLEAHATKEEILRRYLASVYLGEDGAVPIHGFAEAADAYFAKPLGELGPAECALLAGIIRSPNGLAPRQHAAAALARRNRVLAAMVEDGALDQAAGQRARGEPLRLAAPHARPVGALYVADEVARELGRLLPPDAARAPGLAVFTAVDADAQREAERAVRRRLESSDRARARRRAATCGGPRTTTASSTVACRSRTRSPSPSTPPPRASRSTSVSTPSPAPLPTWVSPGRCRWCRPSPSGSRRPRSSTSPRRTACSRAAASSGRRTWWWRSPRRPARRCTRRAPRRLECSTRASRTWSRISSSVSWTQAPRAP